MDNFRQQAIQYRQFIPADLEKIAAIEAISISEPWSLQALIDFSNQETSRILVASYGNSMVVGYITYSVVLDEVQIANIAVSPDFRRHGIAEKMLKTLYANAMASKKQIVTLEVRESNEAAISLYKKCKYMAVGRRKNFYKNPTEDAILMNLFL